MIVDIVKVSVFSLEVNIIIEKIRLVKQNLH